MEGRLQSSLLGRCQRHAEIINWIYSKGFWYLMHVFWQYLKEAYLPSLLGSVPWIYKCTEWSWKNGREQSKMCWITETLQFSWIFNCKKELTSQLVNHHAYKSNHTPFAIETPLIESVVLQQVVKLIWIVRWPQWTPWGPEHQKRMLQHLSTHWW